MTEKEWTIWGIANMGLDSSVGKSAGTSNQRSQVQTPIQSNFLCSSEIELRKSLVLTVPSDILQKFVGDDFQ